ncbi:hypothetical protein CH306_26230 [Rhodococcus sp. 15-725-2-2b]|nr:hypothetical protein CH277_22430 [Rhodococcus sp. 06-469-3-2]OZD40776.1 hypothetical protein CH264_24115 [Rhodococcus sp. 06-1477-1A]OZE67116.1 hypothetical protein CH306_26230 [Rhodococcus sp. 15-725-2-2b]
MESFSSASQLRAAVGRELGPSQWLGITQDRVQQFADATGDHQWIHVDVERASTSPFASTIAHGYLSLSILPMLVRQYYQLEGATMVINYGVNRLRFIAPVPVGSRVRSRSTIIAAGEVNASVQVILRSTLDIEGGLQPACVADALTRVHFPIARHPKARPSGGRPPWRDF